MKIIVSSFLIGILFALGLGLGGMTQPERVVSFLDVAGDWDPSLVFVMVGALLVHSVSYRLIRRRNSPLFAGQFHIPNRKDISFELLAGSALFGIGWGLAGYCPAPALTALASFETTPLIFVVSMIAGMTLYEVQRRVLNRTAKN